MLKHWQAALLCSLLLILASACARLPEAKQPPDFSRYHDAPLPEATKPWLSEGEQSRISPAVTAVAATISGLNRRQRLYQAVDYVWTHFTYDHFSNQRMFNRTADDLFRERLLGGCSDYALVDATLFRALGIPSRLVITTNIDWLQRYQKNPLHIPTGHVFIEVYLEDRWYLVDSTYRLLFSNYQETLRSYPRNEYFCRRGLDYWQLGLRRVDDIKQLFAEQARLFSINLYTNPTYADQPL